MGDVSNIKKKGIIGYWVLYLKQSHLAVRDARRTLRGPANVQPMINNQGVEAN